MRKRILDFLNQHQFDDFSDDELYWSIIEDKVIRLENHDEQFALILKKKDPLTKLHFQQQLADLLETQLLTQQKSRGQITYKISQQGRNFLDPTGGLQAEINRKELQLIRQTLLDALENVSMPETQKAKYKAICNDLSYSLGKELLIEVIKLGLKAVV